MEEGGEPFLFDPKRPRPPPPKVPIGRRPVSSATFSPFPSNEPSESGRDHSDGNIPRSHTRMGYEQLKEALRMRNSEAHRKIDEMLEREANEEERKLRERREAQARIAETMERNPNVSRAPNRISFLPLVERVKIHAEKVKAAYDEGMYIPHISLSYGDANYNDRPTDGEEVYRRLLECFLAFPDPPTQFQHKLFTATMSACAPIIFGEAFFSDPGRCMQIIGGRFTDGLVGILTGRKTGKSTGLAYIAICLMLNIKKFKAIIASKTLEQAKIILDTVKGLIQLHPWWKKNGYSVEESRATALVIKGPDNSLRILEARCGSGEDTGDDDGLV